MPLLCIVLLCNRTALGWEEEPTSLQMPGQGRQPMGRLPLNSVDLP